MIGEVISWQNDFIVISTGEEVYRTENNPYGQVYVEGDVSLDTSVEFDVINNRAVNVKRIFFAPNMNALRRDIHQIKMFNENDTFCNELEREGSLHYETFGRISSILTKNKNDLDVIMPIMKKLGVNLCHRETKPITLTVMDGNQKVDVYDHCFQVGIISTLTRFNNLEASKKAWDEYEDYSAALNSHYYKMCLEYHKAVDIQKKLYFGSALKRKYNAFKYGSPKYNYLKI